MRAAVQVLRVKYSTQFSLRHMDACRARAGSGPAGSYHFLKSKFSLCAENVTILTQIRVTIKNEKKRRVFGRNGCCAARKKKRVRGLFVEERIISGGHSTAPAGRGGPPRGAGGRAAACRGRSRAPEYKAARAGPAAAPRRKAAPQRRLRAAGHSAPGVYAAQAPRPAEFGRRNAARMRAKRRRRRRLVRMAALCRVRACRSGGLRLGGEKRHLHGGGRH